MIEHESSLVNIVTYYIITILVNIVIFKVLHWCLSERCGPGTLISVMFLFSAIQIPTTNSTTNQHTRFGLYHCVTVVVDKVWRDGVVSCSSHVAFWWWVAHLPLIISQSPPLSCWQRLGNLDVTWSSSLLANAIGDIHPFIDVNVVRVGVQRTSLTAQ